MLLLMKIKFYRLCVRNPASGLLQIGHKSEKWQWRYNIDILLFFRPSLVTSPYFMIISSLVGKLSQFSLIKDWQEIQKSEVLPNICRLGRVRDFKFGMNVSNEMLLNAAKCQGYNFYHFWIINEKPTGVNCSDWYTELYAK